MTLIIFFLISIVGGLSAPLVKLTVETFHPILLVFLRSLISLLITLPIILIYNKKLTFSNWIRNKHLLTANLLFAANWILFAFGIQYTSIIMSQLLYLPVALIVSAIGFLFLKEKLHPRQIFGLILTLLGMSLLIKNSIQSQDILSFGKPVGNLIIFAAVLSWSLYLVFSRKVSASYSPAAITFFNFLASAFISAFFLLSPATKFNLQNVSGQAVFGLVALALFSSVIVFYLIQWLVKHTSAFIPSLTLYTTALFASIVGIIFFNEKLSTILIVASVFILIGVFMTTFNQQLKKSIKLLE